MLQNLKNIDAQLQQKKAAFYNNLNAPLTTGYIKELEQKYQVTLPTDLCDVYTWKNGQHENCYEAFVKNYMFTPLQNVLETAAMLTSMIGYDFEIDNWWNKNWLPIFSNGGGDYICYDLEGTFTGLKGQLIQFWHADNDRNVIAPTLQAILADIENDLINKNDIDDGNLFFEIERYPKRFYV